MKMRTLFGDVVVGTPTASDCDEVVYSPLVVEKVVYARTMCTSSADAVQMLRVLADIDLSPSEVDLIVTQAATRNRR
jgi:hypothetical protein